MGPPHLHIKYWPSHSIIKSHFTFEFARSHHEQTEKSAVWYHRVTVPVNALFQFHTVHSRSYRVCPIDIPNLECIEPRLRWSPARWSRWLLCGCWLQFWLSLLKIEVQPVAGDDRAVFFVPKTVTVPVAIYDCFLPCPFYSTHIPMFTVLDPLLEFTYHLLSSWRKFALCIQSLLCMLFCFGWTPCQRSDMMLMGGLPTCQWYDSLYIRIIWLLVCLWNLCKPDMVPVSIYVE